jgi:hypothetical protein
MRAPIGAVALGLLSVACSGGFAVRSADAYRDDSRQLLSTRNEAVRSCYDEALKENPQAAGDVVVNFKVAPETGTVVDPKLDEEKTTAPASLGRCVVRVIDGLKLDPPDRNEGIATFRWAFKANG